MVSVFASYPFPLCISILFRDIISSPRNFSNSGKRQNLHKKMCTKVERHATKESRITCAKSLDA